MLLLFDGVAILLPEQEKEWFYQQDEAVIAGLEEYEVLRCIRPEAVVDRQACDEVVMRTLNLLGSEELKRLPRNHQSMEFYLSKFGSAIDPDLVQDLLTELRKSDLVAPLFSSHSVAIHPALGVLILSEVGRHVIRHARSQRIELFPSTDRLQLHTLIREAGGLVPLGPATRIIATDMEAAGVSLGSVPIDEIIAFRREHHDLLNRYRLGIMEAAQDFAASGTRFEETLLRERREQFEANKASIDGHYRAWLKSRARVGIGFVGAVGNLVTGNYPGAAISAASAMTVTSPTPLATTRMTFLIAAGQKFGTL